MTTQSLILLVLLIAAILLCAARGFGVGYRTWDFGWIGVAIFGVIYLIVTVIA